MPERIKETKIELLPEIFQTVRVACFKLLKAAGLKIVDMGSSPIENFPFPFTPKKS